MSDKAPQREKVSLPWGIKQIKPGAMKTLSDDKLATFVIGKQSTCRRREQVPPRAHSHILSCTAAKTRFEMEKDRKIKKKLEAEQDAARVSHSRCAL
jgi:hypothetical protein